MRYSRPDMGTCDRGLETVNTLLHTDDRRLVTVPQGRIDQGGGNTQQLHMGRFIIKKIGKCLFWPF